MPESMSELILIAPGASDVGARLAGPEDSYLRHIANAAAGQGEMRGRVSVKLVGKGSAPTTTAGTGHLAVELVCSTAEGMTVARTLVRNLMLTVGAEEAKVVTSVEAAGEPDNKLSLDQLRSAARASASKASPKRAEALVTNLLKSGVKGAPARPAKRSSESLPSEPPAQRLTLSASSIRAGITNLAAGLAGAAGKAAIDREAWHNDRISEHRTGRAVGDFPVGRGDTLFVEWSEQAAPRLRALAANWAEILRGEGKTQPRELTAVSGGRCPAFECARGRKKDTKVPVAKLSGDFVSVG